MSDLTLDFEGQAVRVAHDGAAAPWWVAKDVCRVLGLTNSRKAVSSLSEDERKGVTISYTLGGAQVTTCVNEPGLYRLIFQSRKPAAERFKRWVLHEVLPELRRNGSYRMPDHAAPHPAPHLSQDAETWLSLVRETRLTHGRQAARRMWRQSPLPQCEAPAELSPLSQQWIDFIAAFCVVTGDPKDRISCAELAAAANLHWQEQGLEPLGRRASGASLARVIEAGHLGPVRRIKASTNMATGLRWRAS